MLNGSLRRVFCLEGLAGGALVLGRGVSQPAKFSWSELIGPSDCEDCQAARAWTALGGFSKRRRNLCARDGLWRAFGWAKLAARTEGGLFVTRHEQAMSHDDTQAGATRPLQDSLRLCPTGCAHQRLRIRRRPSPRLHGCLRRQFHSMVG